jgi:hypothetical protein
MYLVNAHFKIRFECFMYISFVQHEERETMTDVDATPEEYITG